MKKLEDIYKGSFFKNRYKLSWRTPYVCNAICNVLKPNTIIDVGCGIGDYVKGFNDKGIKAFGLEGSIRCLPHLAVPAEQVFIRDLRNKVYVGTYDAAMCFEVLEHIEPEYVYILINNLMMMSNKLLLSAAPPGQGGHYHVNCQPASYWEHLFNCYGYVRKQNVENAIKHEWQNIKHKKEMSAYYNNLLYFELT